MFRRLLLGMMLVAIMFCMPTASMAACPDPGGSQAGSDSSVPNEQAVPDAVDDAAPIEGRAAGDDPTLTPPTTPTCDDAGYELEFPDVELATDAAEVENTVSGAGYHRGELPMTGPKLSALVAVLVGVLLTNVGVLIYIATQRSEETI